MYLNPTPHMHIFQFVEARSCRRSTSQRRLNFKPFFLPLPTPPFPPPPCSSSSLSQQPRQRERERRNCLSPSSLIFYLLSHFSFLGCMILHGFTFFFFLFFWLGFGCVWVDSCGWHFWSILVFCRNFWVALHLCLVSTLKVLFLCLLSRCKLELQDFWVLVNWFCVVKFCCSLLSFQAWAAVDLHALCMC